MRSLPDLFIDPVSGASFPASSLIRVDLPLPLAPSMAMRSSASKRIWRPCSTGLPLYPTDTSSNVTNGGGSSSASGKENEMPDSCSITDTVSIFSSIFNRDCACFAFVALARKRSTNFITSAFF